MIMTTMNYLCQVKCTALGKTSDWCGYPQTFVWPNQLIYSHLVRKGELIPDQAVDT